MKRLGVAVLLSVALGLVNPVHAATIFFDNTKDQTAGNADWVIDDDQPDPFPANPQDEDDWEGGFSAWGMDLVNLGHTVKTIPPGQRLVYGGSGSLDLSQADILVIPEPQNPYSFGEQEAIREFVSDGGGLFMVSNHANSDRNQSGWDAPQVFNDLGSENLFGIEFEYGVSNDLDSFTEDITNLADLSGNTVMDGPHGTVDFIAYHAGGCMRIHPQQNPNVEALGWRNGEGRGNDYVVLARSEYGRGRVVAIGDSSPADDGTGAPGNRLFDGWTEGDARAYHLNGIEWLLEGPGRQVEWLALDAAFTQQRDIEVDVEFNNSGFDDIIATLFVAVEVDGAFFFLMDFSREARPLIHGFFPSDYESGKVRLLDTNVPNVQDPPVNLTWHGVAVNDRDGSILGEFQSIPVTVR